MNDQSTRSGASIHKEIVLEDHLVDQLVAGQEYVLRASEDFDRPSALDRGIAKLSLVGALGIATCLGRIEPHQPRGLTMQPDSVAIYHVTGPRGHASEGPTEPK